MPTFIYSPEIRVHVACDGTNLPGYSGLTLDLSPDLVQGSLTIRTNGVHTFNFQLQNAQRKYDGVLQPMDRITVEMKRITWVRVFSGYLNNGPIFSAWPRVLNMSASCTLKRLQFWYWDPTTVAAMTLLQSIQGAGALGSGAPGGNGNAAPMSGQNPGTTVNARLGGRMGDTPTPIVPGLYNEPPTGTQGTIPVAPPPAPPAPGAGTPPPAAPAAGSGTAGSAPPAGVSKQTYDDSIKTLVLKLLTTVVAWPQEKIHIGELPDAWVQIATEVGNAIIKDSNVPKALIGDLAKGDQAAVGGAGSPTGSANEAIPPGNVLQWCQQGVALAGLPAEYANGLAKQAMFESSGNPHATQGVVDINSVNGTPALGLLQMVPSTFMAHAVPGHTDIWNPVDNAASAARYALATYGPGWFDGPHVKGY